MGEYPDANDPYQRYGGLIERYGVLETPELISGNLIEIYRFHSVWSASSAYTTYTEINRNVKYPLPYTLYENRIISLTKYATDNPLMSIIDPSTICEISTTDWAKDEDKRRILKDCRYNLTSAIY